MRMAFWKQLTVLASLGVGLNAGLSLGLLTPTVQAAQFDQQEIDPSRFIILAAPGGELGYKLLILEQIKDNRPCWSETSGSPSSVEPLLLTFDFTGICNRIVDSNGFSVRAAGQDEGLNYSLRIIPQENDLVLVAASNSQRNSLVEIGRTNGLPVGFSRINLNPGWRLTRRAFNGRAVGHVYLTYDQPIDMLATNNLRRSTGRAQQAPILPPVAPSSEVIPVPSLPPGSATPTSPTAPSPQLLPLPGSPSTNPGSLLPPPPPANPAAILPASPTPSGATGSLPPATGLATGLAMGGTSSSPAVRAAAQPVAQPTLPAQTTSAPASRQAPTASSSTVAAAPADVFQVIVEADSAEMQDKVRAIAPSALLTTINGQVVMQVGIFRDRQEADRLQQRLSQEGLPTAVIPVR